MSDWQVEISEKYTYCAYDKIAYRRITLPFVPVPGMWIYADDFDAHLIVVGFKIDEGKFYCESEGVDYSRNTFSTSDNQERLKFGLEEIQRQFDALIEQGWLPE